MEDTPSTHMTRQIWHHGHSVHPHDSIWHYGEVANFCLYMHLGPRNKGPLTEVVELWEGLM